MLDAARYRKENNAISYGFLVALRMKEYLTYAPKHHSLTYHEALKMSNQDLGVNLAPSTSIDEWFESRWKEWEQWLKKSPPPKLMFLLAAEAGLLEVQYARLPSELWAWLKKTDAKFHAGIQRDWYVDERKKFMNLLRMGWEVNGEKGALICIKPHWPNIYRGLNDSVTQREWAKERNQQPGDPVESPAMKYAEGKCPACANPRCTGPHSFFHTT